MKISSCCSCCLLIFAYLPYMVISGDINEKRLIRDLLNNYDRRLRPSKNLSEPLNVTFGLALAQLIDVDEKNQIVTTNCWLNQAWIDYDLQWDPKLYGGIDTIMLPYDSVWLPDIVLYNNADIASSKTSAVSTNVIITHTGNVTFLSMVIYKSSCTMNVRYFPFDEQNCSMLFASWTYDGSQIDLILVDKKGDLSNYMPSSEFDMIDLLPEKNVRYYSCCPHPFPDITYYLVMRRRPMFYVFNMLLPCCLITLVALLGFYIPSDSGEKVTMGITTLLSMTVFLMLVTEAMPPTSDHLPLIGIYYFITIGIVSLATAMTVCTLNIHHRGTRGKIVPYWIQFVCFKILAKIFCIPIEYPDPDILPPEESKGKVKHDTSEAAHRKRKIRSSKANGTGVELKERLITTSSSCAKISDNAFIEPPQAAYYGTGKMNGHLSPPPPIINGNNGYNNSLPVNNMEAGWPQNHHNQSLLKPHQAEKLDAHFTKVLQTITESIMKNEMRLVDQDRRDAVKLQWQQVAMVVDRLLLIIFVTLTIGITLGLTLQGVV